jgi:hypothetical protein
VPTSRAILVTSLENAYSVPTNRLMAWASEATSPFA